MQKLHLMPPLKVAEELLLIDSFALRKIQPDELADEAWIGKRKDELSPNITAMVHHFNSLALLVPTEILAETTTQMRAKVISTFIKVAEVCHKLKNYHSLKAVLAGLQCTPVYRLRKTWKRVPSIRIRMFQKLSTLMGEEGNCILYHKETGQNIEKEVPFVPYLGFFLTQIVHQACHQQMSDKKVVEFKRRGAMLKRYKSHPPIIISSARSDEDGGIACSDPCDLTNALSSQIDESCKISCGLTGNATISVSYDAVTPLSVEIDAVTPSINEDFFNDASAFSPPYNSPPPHSPEFCSLSTLDSLHPPMVCSISFSSSPFSTLQPCSLSKSHSAELMCPQGKGTFLADKSPVPMMLNMSLSSEALDSKVSNLELECHPKLQKPGDGGSGVCRFADSGVCLNESSSSIKEAGLHGSGNSPVHGSSRERLRGDQVSPLQCSPRYSVVPEEQCSGEVEGHRALSKCLTLNVHSPCAPTRHPASADRSSSLGCRLATTLGCVDLKQLLRNPKELLSRYQICSLSCAINVQSKEDVRNLISNHHCNTEMENYVLSYQREPP